MQFRCAQLILNTEQINYGLFAAPYKPKKVQKTLYGYNVQDAVHRLDVPL